MHPIHRARVLGDLTKLPQMDFGERLYEKPSNTGETPRHEANHGSIHQRLAARTKLFVVFTYPPVLVDPGQRALHHPPGHPSGLRDLLALFASGLFLGGTFALFIPEPRRLRPRRAAGRLLLGGPAPATDDRCCAGLGDPRRGPWPLAGGGRGGSAGRRGVGEVGQPTGLARSGDRRSGRCRRLW